MDVRERNYGTAVVSLPRVPVAGDIVSVIPGSYDGSDPPSELCDVKEVVLFATALGEEEPPACIVEWRR